MTVSYVIDPIACSAETGELICRKLLNGKSSQGIAHAAGVDELDRFCVDDPVLHVLTRAYSVWR